MNLIFAANRNHNKYRYKKKRYLIHMTYNIHMTVTTKTPRENIMKSHGHMIRPPQLRRRGLGLAAHIESAFNCLRYVFLQVYTKRVLETIGS